MVDLYGGIDGVFDEVDYVVGQFQFGGDFCVVVEISVYDWFDM